jgi:hypothetical protein
MLYRVVIAAGLSAAALVVPAKAQDASFGCKVLLCAAASTPGWSGIPYCVPVMQQLFSNLAKGQGWPACSEGNAGSVGYDPLDDCPQRTAAADRQEVGTSDNGVGIAYRYTANPSGAYCVPPDQLNPDTPYAPGNENVTVRGQRADPYYVNIKTADSTSRFWFSLDGK